MRPLDGPVLVTGAAGFIGSALVWALNQRGISRIVISDAVSPAKERNLAGLRFETLLAPEELRKAALAGSLRQFSCVLHMGACSSTTETNLDYLLDNNYAFTRDLCTWAVNNKARFIYASSAATYGDGSQGMEDSDERLDDLKPLNLYGQSKHLFDVWARKEGLLPHIYGMKYFNVFGPNEDHKGDMRSVVHKAFHEAMSSGSITLFRSHRPEYADGEQRRDFLYIKDAVAMTLHFAANEDVPGGLYNLGSGTAHSWKELAHAIFSALGRAPDIRYIDMPEFLRPRYQYFTRASIEKLRRSGCRHAVTSLDEAVADCVKKHLLPDRRLGES